jgi:hypothetical protein
VAAARSSARWLPWRRSSGLREHNEGGTSESGKRGNERSVSSGCPHGRRQGVGTREGNAASMAKKLWCMAATQANPRTRGVRASVRLGDHVWVSYGPNWAMGLKAKL